eukprot:2970909-Rhodomonas_salina.1
MADGLAYSAVLEAPTGAGWQLLFWDTPRELLTVGSDAVLLPVTAAELSGPAGGRPAWGADGSVGGRELGCGSTAGTKRAREPQAHQAGLPGQGAALPPPGVPAVVTQYSHVQPAQQQPHVRQSVYYDEDVNDWDLGQPAELLDDNNPHAWLEGLQGVDQAACITEHFEAFTLTAVEPIVDDTVTPITYTD